MGVRIDPVSEEEFLARVARFLASDRSHVVHFCPADPIVVASQDTGYRDVLNRGSLNAPDGMSVVYTLRSLGYDAQRLTGSTALQLLCAWGLARGARHYLFGGRLDVVQLLRRRLESAYPGIGLVAAESPPFRPLADREVREAAVRIREAGTDILWVGLGAPKQEILADRLHELESAPVILCVGAAFDFVSGVKRRAPAWMQDAGLEWLHRLACDPRRLARRYLLGNPRFVAGVLGEHLRLRGHQ